MSSITFWTENQVGGPYLTLEDSQEALRKRHLQYPRLPILMPVDGCKGKTVLDYGCGPGHDTLQFLIQGAGHVFYYDISPTAMEEVDRRLELHGLADRASPVERAHLPKVEHVHCAGVLHHTEDPLGCLKDMSAALKPSGEARVMIYDGDTSTKTQSKVPITEWWNQQEFTYLAYMAGFDTEKMGIYECSAPWRPDCWAACYRLVLSR